MAVISSPFRCRYCGADNMSIWCHATDQNRRAGTQVFTVARCNSCGILQTHPLLAPEELSTYYPDEYFPDPRQSAALRAFERKKVDLVRRFCNGGRLLDVGAGVGLFVREAQDAGFAAEGIELSAQAVDLGRQSLGVRLTSGDLLDLPMPADAFDIVTLWHVLEHLPNPKASLEKIFQILRKSGALIIAVPNAGSLQARVFRSRWFHLDVPRHLFHYTRTSLTGVLRDAGFDVQQVIFRHAEHDRAGILGSIMRLSPPGESLFHKLLRKGIGAPVAALLAAGEAFLSGESGTFVAIARKKE